MQKQSRRLRHRQPDRQGREAVRVREAHAPSPHGHRGNRLRVLRPRAHAMAAAQRLVDGTSRHCADGNRSPDPEIRARRGAPSRAATGRGGAGARGRTHTILVQQRWRLCHRLRPEWVRAVRQRSGARIAGGPGDAARRPAARVAAGGEGRSGTFRADDHALGAHARRVDAHDLLVHGQRRMGGSRLPCGRRVRPHGRRKRRAHAQPEGAPYRAGRDRGRHRARGGATADDHQFHHESDGARAGSSRRPRRKGWR